MSIYAQIESAIAAAIDRPFKLTDRRPIGGGCISQAERIGANADFFFLKTNDASFLDQFEAEQESLNALANSGALKTPRPICSGIAEGKSYLVMEYIAIGSPNDSSWIQLGEGLAALHRATQPYYGWIRDNAIGATPQANPVADEWIPFFREHRLGFQLDLARANGFSPKGARELLDRIPRFFENYQPQPSLLHGDLWSGNVAFTDSSEPFLFDPCCYFGDRETDLAFTDFFGGFPAAFYAAYQRAFPLDPGYAQRKGLYNLYHCLNHFNLFGGPYDRQAQSMIDSLLAWSES